MTTKNWTVIPGDRALRSALARADSIDNQLPTVTDYQKNKLDIALGFVKNFTTAIDGGANYGIMSYNLNSRFSKIYAFEVDTPVRDCLKKNESGDRNTSRREIRCLGKVQIIIE